MRNIKIIKACVITNMYIVLEILESDIELKTTWNNNKEFAELKTKIHKVRMDTKEIEKYLKYYQIKIVFYLDFGGNYEGVFR